ncbi:biotin/lipoyl-binding protein [Candidatus Nephthysia bennettiae]|uniref:Biotin/lipoyl-binding protein n=1 Tax=Candidatus Nephthysia bennettiae TaxID=3127016 RepID=A0A934K8V9_9BACT|nr:biotin/lipoyl-binding protein [Candidatus Dormibacteraeota bacterium]MBJ7612510.1 biotin/lipoyl-binding protein [Candidatus Dormibacteraeota bacterium]
MRQGLARDRLTRPAITRQHAIVGVLALLALVLLAVIVSDVFFPRTGGGTAARTFAVQRGMVQAAVTGTGTIVPASQQNVGFRVAGQLSEVDVKVGDHVGAGQVLARIDPTTYQTALDQASASLQQAQATLSNTLNGNAVQSAQHSLASAQQLYNDTVNSINLTNQQDANSVAADQQQLSSDQAASLSSGQLSEDQSAVNVAQDQLNQDNAQFQRFQCFANPPPNPAACPTGIQLQRDQQALSQAQQKLNLDNQASSRVTADQQKLSQDQFKATSDQVNGQKQLDQGQSSITQAQDQLNSQTIQRPNTILQQEAQVASAQAQVQAAQNNLKGTTLAAPVDGTILSLSGAVGETVGTGGGLTALAPGSSAPQPSSSGASSASGASGSSGGGASGGSSGFAVLGNISGLEVVAPFAEADAAKVSNTESGTVTFDALPGLSVPAHVLAVAASSTVVSNVTNYYVTLNLDQPDQRLKSGMTANANVVVSQASDVLMVPNSAITRLGGQAYVTVLSSDGKTQTRIPVETGTVGDSTTEISSGLSEGQKVVLPQLRLSNTSGTGTGRGLGGGGGGGGGAVRVG